MLPEPEKADCPSAINPIKSGYNTDFILLPTLKPTLKPTFNSPLRYKNFSQGGKGFPLSLELSLTPYPPKYYLGLLLMVFT